MNENVREVTKHLLLEREDASYVASKDIHCKSGSIYGMMAKPDVIKKGTKIYHIVPDHQGRGFVAYVDDSMSPWGYLITSDQYDSAIEEL